MRIVPYSQMGCVFEARGESVEMRIDFSQQYKLWIHGAVDGAVMHAMCEFVSELAKRFGWIAR